MKTSWLSPINEESDFSLQNLPFGVFSPSASSSPRCGTVLGETVIDLATLEEAGLFADILELSDNVFNRHSLNYFIEHPRPVWEAVRNRLQLLLGTDGTDRDDRLRQDINLQKSSCHNVNSVTMHMPIEIKGYTDFYSSREHATNVGMMFRGSSNPLQPNWLHLPVGYHGRSSTVFLSGHPIRRPSGQIQKDSQDPSQGSIHGACQNLDFELEVAAVVGGPPNPAGQPLSVTDARDRIFGYLLMNDWSARDIQKWEYVPLGPFTAKNFATTVSPWIVTAMALQEFSVPTSAVEQTNPEPLSYLHDPSYASYDINLSVSIKSPQQTTGYTVCRSNFRNMYWTPAQQLAHHSVSGCVMIAGDLLGSGTISGQSTDSFGSLLELSWNGTRDVQIGGETRRWLMDGDEVTLHGFCQREGQGRVGFGVCSGTIMPALSIQKESTRSPLTKERYGLFTLYGDVRTPSTWCIQIALAAKRVDYTVRSIQSIRPDRSENAILAMTPFQDCPVLEFNDTNSNMMIRIRELIPIVSFLDDIYPSRRSLIPSNPLDKAEAMYMVEIIRVGLNAIENTLPDNISSENQTLSIKEEYMKVLERQVTSRRQNHHGPFCLGSFSPTIVDSFLVMYLFKARESGLGLHSICPKLLEIESLCLQHSWFHVCTQSLPL